MVRLGQNKNENGAQYFQATYQRHPVYQKALSGLQATSIITLCILLSSFFSFRAIYDIGITKDGEFVYSVSLGMFQLFTHSLKNCVVKQCFLLLKGSSLVVVGNGSDSSAHLRL